VKHHRNSSQHTLLLVALIVWAWERFAFRILQIMLWPYYSDYEREIDLQPITFTAGVCNSFNTRPLYAWLNVHSSDATYQLAFVPPGCLATCPARCRHQLCFRFRRAPLLNIIFGVFYADFILVCKLFTPTSPILVNPCKFELLLCVFRVLERNN
jgi:hypothetical protein